VQHAYDRARNQQHREQEGYEYQLVEQRVPQVARKERPEICTQQPFLRSQIVAVVAQVANLAPFRYTALHVAWGAELILHFLDADPFLMHPAHQPAANVSSAGNRRDVVDRPQQLGLAERLQDPQVKSSAPDSAA
jgi:hypothetical protein